MKLRRQQASKCVPRSRAALIVALTCASAPLWSQSPATSSTGHAPFKTASAQKLVYTNRKYGFHFFLPANWAGYTVIERPWNPEYGTEIVIRHPLWSQAKPREDIPIDVYTHRQWRDIQTGQLNVSAAPFPPSELGHNKRFVFALRPRWNYDFSNGWEEAQAIVRDGLHAF
jgi:hypothetical protein